MSYRFAYPVKPWENFRIESEAGFLDPAYFTRYGRNHKGIDINLRTGGDSDLGYPLQAIVPGEIVSVGLYKGWGGVIVLEAAEWVRAHAEAALGVPLPVLQLAYCHTLRACVQPGEKVNAGECLGSIGKGDRDQFKAHLHLEVRRKIVPANEPQGTGDDNRRRVLMDYLDPARFLGALALDDRSNIHPEHQQVTPPASAFSLESGPITHTPGRRYVTNYVSGKVFVRSEDA